MRRGKSGCQNTPESMPHSSFHISFSKEIFYKGKDPTIDAGDKKIQMAKEPRSETICSVYNIGGV